MDNCQNPEREKAQDPLEEGKKKSFAGKVSLNHGAIYPALNFS